MKEQFIEEYNQYKVTLQKNVVFGNANGFPLKMDILFSKEKKLSPAPVILWIHGGGWSDHELDRNYRPDIELLKLAVKGYFIVCCDYRLADQAPFPAQIQDCKCAVRFLRAHAQEWDLDPERIGVWGESAGGHLVNLLGSTENVEEFEGDAGWQAYSSKVNAVCSWYAPSDMTTMDAGVGTVVHSLLGKPLKEEMPEKLKWVSPITYVHREMPPFLIMHGTTDALVDTSQSQKMYDALKERGVPVELHWIEGQGHGFFQGEQPYQFVNDFFDKWFLVR